MKSFNRTAAGKALLFCLCVICAVSFVLSAGAAVIMIDEDFYSAPPEEISAYGFDGDSIAMQIVFRNIMNNAHYSLAEYEVLNQDGDVISARGSAGGRPIHTSYVLVYMDENGDYSGISTTDSSFGPDTYTVKIYFYDGPGRDDAVATRLTELMYAMRYWVYAVIGGSFVIGLICIIALMSACGRRPGDEELHPGFIGRVPYDLLLAAAIVFVCFVFMIADELIRSGHTIINLIAAFGAVTLFMAAGVFVLCCTAVHAKQGSMIKGTLSYKCLHFCLSLLVRSVKWFFRLCAMALTAIKRLPLIPKTAVLIAAVFLFECINTSSLYMGHYGTRDFSMFLWFVEKLVLAAAVVYAALMLKRLQAGAKRIAGGDLSSAVSTDKMLPVFRQSADDLNSIGIGMNRAVDERLRSERMKIELITNVSHDIKTPLTSIINYASLIAEEKTDNEKISEYSRTLVNHSVRLKRLLEDLVEAAKADTGNLEVILAPCSAGTFVSQAEGEYGEKLAEHGLTLITSQPAGDVIIMADGRRMSRIFDNLFNNICKYAMPGTRVYLNLTTNGDKVCFAFKNTSREELNISSDELMERFVRGDSSRNTEGSGLGLSIARSLTELQNGTMVLTVDGDLFKAEISFKAVKS